MYAWLRNTNLVVVSIMVWSLLQDSHLPPWSWHLWHCTIFYTFLRMHSIPSPCLWERQNPLKCGAPWMWNWTPLTRCSIPHGPRSEQPDCFLQSRKQGIVGKRPWAHSRHATNSLYLACLVPILQKAKGGGVCKMHFVICMANLQNKKKPKCKGHRSAICSRHQLAIKTSGKPLLHS